MNNNPSTAEQNKAISIDSPSGSITMAGTQHYTRVDYETDLAPLRNQVNWLGNDPSWTYGQQNLPVDLALMAPRLTASFDEVGNIEVSCKLHPIDLDGSKELEIFVFKKTESPSTLFAVAAYQSKNLNHKTEVVECKFTISASYISSEHITNLEMYLLQKDPKTSRGTVTTVQSHVFPSVKKEK